MAANAFFFDKYMTRITDNWTKSRILNFSREIACENVNNLLLPMLKSCQNLIQLEDS